MNANGICTKFEFELTLLLTCDFRDKKIIIRLKLEHIEGIPVKNFNDIHKIVISCK